MAYAVHGRRAAAAALLACALLLGCAGGGAGSRAGGEAGGGDGGGGPAVADRGRFKGLYKGRQFPSDTNNALACRGRTREVWFDVEGGTVEMRNSRHRRNRRKLGLVGTVSADGSVALRHADGGRTVVGRIEGDRLAATTVQDSQTVQAVQAGGKVPCAYRYDATRTGSSGPGRDDGAAVAAPPVERVPQP